MDSFFRLAVNLKGAPAMELSEARQWRQQHLLGASLKIVAPTGQYDPTKLINLGSNRWAIKPELGYSGRFGHWLLDAYASVWFFTSNPEFFSRNQYVPGTQAQTQDPIAALETHLSYDFKPRLWVSLDGNFWYGGRTSLNGVENPATLQQSSRIGVTSSFPVTSPVDQGRIRGRGVRPLRRQLQDRLSGLAVLVAQQPEVTHTLAPPAGVRLSSHEPVRLGEADALFGSSAVRDSSRLRTAAGPDYGLGFGCDEHAARERDDRAPGTRRAAGAVRR